MSLGSFLKFVEIRTKIASVIPFALGAVYSLYHYKSFKFYNFIIMFISLIAFDMATTAINNYCDYKKANKSHLDSCKVENIVIEGSIKESTALVAIFSLLTIAVTFGIILTLNTNIIVLFIGVVSFFIGIFYTFGPIPISRMPLGELFSGFFMGFVILFLSIYIHIYDQNIVSLVYRNNILTLSINVIEIFYIFLYSIPSIVGISNIMLANNICDIEKDIINNRYTLPYYISKKRALQLFKILYFIGYIDIIILFVLKIIPSIAILALITIIPINKNINIFVKKPIKSETFALAVKNFLFMNIIIVFFIGITVFINY
ncbi:1,4-dihydroxy-2-naphthoate polyprenyltransferase [Clostridium sp. OS1-26]|uniref:1,4-dihydroxy-2-naphthoate polyprenyltransferase n=1 Tax=Clostridium sp. OS1-26 TaxID=3070681 RepID=UPI0027DF775F|nr:1,4-dihydroxy-2-naphthoate polyprenyltransferase [Clostridium sp. OS1-26]WML35241.1 1,4-dihydroxy-2-naphthoate polyprenyltransferase [Clostridium sp. OS1-26]